MIPGKNPRHPSFRRSFLFAFQGFRSACAQERNFKVMLAGGAFAIVMGVVCRLDLVSWAIILVCIAAVLASELLNTAIETVVDLVSPEFHPLAGRAKDVAAAATWVTSVLVALAGICVYANALFFR